MPQNITVYQKDSSSPAIEDFPCPRPKPLPIVRVTQTYLWYVEIWLLARRCSGTDNPMIGLVIVTHGGLANEFRAAVEHVVGPQTQLETISIAPEDDAEARRSDILSACRRVDSGQGVILLTDMFGGTPSNLSISVMDDANVEAIAGVNLPMLIKLATIRADNTLRKAVDLAKDAGKKYIIVASQVLSGES
jgi:mannose PTS system EIIA component